MNWRAEWVPVGNGSWWELRFRDGQVIGGIRKSTDGGWLAMTFRKGFWEHVRAWPFDDRRKAAMCVMEMA